MMHAAGVAGRNLDAFVVRKSGKAHGLQRRIEGPDVAGRRVLAVEDTSTTGASVLTAVDALREAGAPGRAWSSGPPTTSGTCAWADAPRPDPGPGPGRPRCGPPGAARAAGRR